VTHDPNCAIVRSGDLRAWCDCQHGGNKIPASYLKRFLPSQGNEADPEMSYEMRLFLDQMGG
jgi:hypothetical protein